jgi:quercetin dioxygenase-like cupin family protein
MDGEPPEEARAAPSIRRQRQQGEQAMSTFKMSTAVFLAALLCCISVPLRAQDHPTVALLMTKELADMAGKEVLILTVDFAPGGADPIHRHNAHGFIYVLEGSVVMQVAGAEPVTLTAGQTYYEGPDDVHIVGRNASSTRPARLLAVLLKNEGAPATVLVNEREVIDRLMMPTRR